MTCSHDRAFSAIYDNKDSAIEKQVSCFLETTELAAVILYYCSVTRPSGQISFLHQGDAD